MMTQTTRQSEESNSMNGL